MTDAPPSRSQEKFIVRLPAGMRDQIEDAAKRSGRSMNAEIVARLQASFPASLASVMLQNRGEELIVAQRDIDAELVFLDTLLRTGAKAALVEETRSRIELLTERKTSIQAEIDLLNGRVRKIEEFVLHGPKKGKKRS